MGNVKRKQVRVGCSFPRVRAMVAQAAAAGRHP